MSNSSDEQQPENSNADKSTASDQESGAGITDDKLPEDLRPTDDNPLAKPMGADEDDDDDKGAGPSADLPDMGGPGAG
ncbi:MAG: hypothetical protein M3Y66_07000 [Actinomycetota bacterium]|nr:hypothetical protein [Actinomycetota bacterium]